MRATRGAMLCLVLSLIGIGLCAYLTFLHLALLRGELLGGAACGAAGSIFNCHAVTASRFGTLLGLPLSLWGLVAYVATAALALSAWQFADTSSDALTALFGLSLLCVVVDAALAVVMFTQIHLLCPLCLASYAINVLLLLSAHWALQTSWAAALSRIPAAFGAWMPRPRAGAVWMVWAMVLTGLLGAVAVQASARYMVQGPPGALRKQLLQFVSQQQRAQVDVTGDPIKGKPHQAFQVVEFSDLFCPSCQRAATLNPIFLANHRHDVTFVFKHYPLDQACNSTMKRTVHPNACRLAAATECAHEQGKFWELHDLIFAKAPPYPVDHLTSDAQRLGLNVEQFQVCLDSGRGLEAVLRDVQEGNRLNVTSTPTYLINGLPVPGVLTPTVLEEFVQTLRDSGAVSTKR
jgi:protein-disulfide isomerase/uncharacterized membrane protein